MRTSPLATVKAQLSALVDEVHRTHERVTITRNGEPVAVLLAVDDFESLMETLDILSDPKEAQEILDDIDEADRAIAKAEQTGDWSAFATLDDVRADLEARRQGA